MILTLIKTVTASDAASISFVDGTSSVVLDNTYDEYMFVLTDIGPADDNVNFGFQVNATDDAGGGYDTSIITSTYFQTLGYEDDSANALAYEVDADAAQSSSFVNLAHSLANDADAAASGVFHLFVPSSTTFVKHFYSRLNIYGNTSYSSTKFVAGYINDTTAIDEIQFKMTGGNMDGVIQLFGVA